MDKRSWQVGVVASVTLRKAILAVVVALAVSEVACWRPERQAQVEALARIVPVAMAKHLVEDDDGEFRSYAADAGMDFVLRSYSLLFRAPHDTSPEAFEDVELMLTPYCDRLGKTLASEFGLQVIPRRHAAYRQRPLHDRMRIVALLVESVRLADDTTLPLEEKASGYLHLIEESKDLGQVSSVGEFYASYCELLPRLRRGAELGEFLEAGIRIADRDGDDAIACQMLGQLGAWHAQRGDFESMHASWNRASQLARRAGSWQESRILSFYAMYYRDLGQLALAREYFLQAQLRCRELRAGRNEIRFCVQFIEFLASLECWKLVDRELQGADLLLRRCKFQSDSLTASPWAARLQLLRMERAAAGGDCRESWESVRTTLQQLSALPPSPWREQVRLASGRALLRCGMLGASDSVLAAGREACVRFHIPELLPHFDLEIAGVRLCEGDAPGTEASLREFRRAIEDSTEGAADLWSRHDIRSVRAAMLSGRRDLAWRRFHQALVRAVRRQERLGSSPEAYLAWTESDELRELGHELLGTDPGRGYAFEMSWRRMFARRGRSSWRSLDGRAAVAEELENEARTLTAAVAKANAVHCVYLLRDTGVVRWTTVAGGIEREMLAADSGEIAALVGEVRDGFASKRKPNRDFYRASARLGRLLLPPELLEHSKVRRVLISGDGVLAELPFAALSLSSERYEPLISRYDLASLRFDVRPGGAAADSSLVIFDPLIAPSLRRRFSALQEALPRAGVEAIQARAVLPGAMILSGSEATKQAVLERAPQAPVIYLASHIVQDPEIPYIGFVPLASKGSQRADDSYLELSDILATDLSRCRLAVLSGCGSGRGYVSTAANCPSLGEALVDAGVHAVVQTYVDVRDGDAETLMVGFLVALGHDRDPVRALAEAQSGAHRSGRDPAEWAAYSITLGTLDDTAWTIPQ